MIEALETHPAAIAATEAMLSADPANAEEAAERYYAFVLDQMAEWLRIHPPSAALRRELRRHAPGLYAAAVE